MRGRGYGRMMLSLLVAGALCAWAASGAYAAGSPGAESWGSNADGQLGDGTTASSLDPVPIGDLSGVSALSGSKEHALALLSTGKVMAWGDNANGQLGDGTTTSSSVPVEVRGISTATAVAAGDEFSLALLANGTVVAWGLNSEGQLGNGSITSSDVPVTVGTLKEITAIAAGLRHGLALTKGGKVMAWGADLDGQLGNGTTTTGDIEPVQVSELSEAKAIAAGGLSSYAVLSNGTVKSWGDNAKGQLGNATTTNSDLPVAVKGLVGAKSVGAGIDHALALTSAGSVYAWGDGTQGELGNGADTSAEEPVQVQGLSEATAVAAGANFSLALLASGGVDSWGADGEGQLGNGTTAGTDTATAVPNLAAVQGIAAGEYFGLAFGAQLPTVSGVSPTFGPATGATKVRITGTGFNLVKSVHFGTASATYTVESETVIEATSPGGNGVVDVTVSTAGGTSPSVTGDRFSYAPVISSVAPDSGPQIGGTEVVISGLNLTGVSAVSFGSTSAVSFKDESATEVIAVSPAGVGTVDVTLTGPGGPSEALTADHFTYTSAAPELGRCRKPGGKKKHKGAGATAVGEWANSSCTEAQTDGRFEWAAGPGVRSSFRVKIGVVQLETAAGSEVLCRSGIGTGEYSGARSLKSLALELKGCQEGHVKCSSTGAAREGDISSALAAEFGVIEKGGVASEDELGLDLKPAASGPLLEFKCGTVVHVWRGSVIAPVKANKMQKTVELTFALAKGHQKIERFEGAPKDAPESSTGGGAYEAAALAMSVELKGRAEIEINSVH